ncbi:hypothetical protein VZT92_013054 [Zoarces viviparus]|uniref:Uncharacterized protein n=1 Tax=Zoarces viviparus TaxID=48416 RepID=A0AAW1F3I5_ZOAVI
MRRKAVLETSHSSTQEVDWRSGMHGYLAAGPIHRTGCVREGASAGRGAAEGGEAVLGFAECKMSRSEPKGLVSVYVATIRKTPEISVARVR